MNPSDRNSLNFHHWHVHLSDVEQHLLQQLRQRKPARNPPTTTSSLGDRVADKVAAIMGSWRFIIIQSILLSIWIGLNVIAYVQHWDPYPFILLNLMLSFQAAYTAPIIMMSQNRQATIDRQDAKHDYEVNLKAELEVELLQAQLHSLQDQELAQIIQMLQQQQETIDRLTTVVTQRLAE